MCSCDCCQRGSGGRFRPFSFLFSMVLVYLFMLVGGGTLINTGHPVAVESGRLLHTVTFVEPAIHWADSRGIGPLAHGLRLAAGGLPVGSWFGHGA